MNAPLRYQGTLYPDYFVLSDKRLVRRSKSKHKSGPHKGKRKFKLVKLHSRPDGYEIWYVRNAVPGRPRQGIIVSRAVAESFADSSLDTRGLVAAHGPGMKKSDGALGTCTFKTQKANRHDRLRDGTYSTGHCMLPGKLRGKHDAIIRSYRETESMSKTAKEFDCTRQAIRKVLRDYGIID